MWEVNWKTTIIFGIIFAVITVVLFFLGLDLFPIQLDISNSEKKVMVILGFAMIVFTSGTFLSLLIYQIIQQRRLEYFGRNGVRAVATILSAKETDEDTHDANQFDIEMRISIPGEMDYYIKKKFHVRKSSLYRLQPGESFEVLVDKNNRNNVFIEIS